MNNQKNQVINIQRCLLTAELTYEREGDFSPIANQPNQLA